MIVRHLTAKSLIVATLKVVEQAAHQKNADMVMDLAGGLKRLAHLEREETFNGKELEFYQEQVAAARRRLK